MENSSDHQSEDDPDEIMQSRMLDAQRHIEHAAMLATTTKAESTQKAYKTAINDWKVSRISSEE